MWSMNRAMASTSQMHTFVERLKEIDVCCSLAMCGSMKRSKLADRIAQLQGQGCARRGDEIIRQKDRA